MNFDRLRFVAERAELGEAREALFAVTIPERPGAFRQFCATLGRRVVTEFNYRLSAARAAHIFVGSPRIRQNAVELTTLLQIQRLPDRDLTDNEMAKLHVRYMVGGRSPGVATSSSVASSFPKDPAPVDFLDRLGGRWNISLFHYRNHGSDFGRVLAGFEVPKPMPPTSRSSSAPWGIFISAKVTTGRTRCSWVLRSLRLQRGLERLRPSVVSPGQAQCAHPADASCETPAATRKPPPLHSHYGRACHLKVS